MRFPSLVRFHRELASVLPKDPVGDGKTEAGAALCALVVKKGSKTRWREAGEIPGPVSLIRT